MGWIEFAAAFAVFLMSHMLPVRPPLRPWLIGRLGARGFALAYSLLSTGVLIWLIAAAGRAPYLPLWNWAPWQAHVPVTVMLPVCLIVAFAIARPNPFSFGGSARVPFDPTHPGILRWMRHPLLVAMALWAGAHVVPNGDLAHVLLFGVFAGFALLGQRLVDRRMRRQLGAEWARLRASVAATPLLPIPANWPAAALRAGIGAGLYLALLALHPWVIGVSPLP